MKNSCIRLFITTALLTATTPAAFSEEPAKPAPPPPAQAPAKPSIALSPSSMDDETLKSLSRDELRTLMRLVELTPEQLAALRDSIERLEKMTPEERKALHRKLEKIREATPRDAEKEINQLRNNPLLRYWRTLPREKAKEEHAKFQKMSQEARRAYVHEIRAKLPPPPPPAPGK